MFSTRIPTTPRWLMVLALLPLTFPSLSHASAGEHPKEHPKGDARENGAVTKEDLAKAVEDYVKKTAAKKGGHFTVYDGKENKKLSLTLTRVHKDRLSRVGPGTYFACADFVAENGDTYDLDIFMKGENAESLEATDVTIHKKNGAERYTWSEEDGVWVKKTSGSGGEHPTEHPLGR
ncbi:MAG: hypothetical protein ACNS63_06605 [Candidatus Nitrospinota bacterium M3_3B_026]